MCDTQAMTDYRFKLGMFLNELGQPFDQGLATAKEIGAQYVWFDRLPDEPPIAELSDAEVDRLAERVSRHGLELFLIAAGSPFKFIHISELDPATMTDDPAFRADFDALVRSMQIAARLGVGAVLCYSFAWPGEYTGDKPTWPMRWLTRGGVIAESDLEKLIKAYSLVLEQADRYGVDVVLSMMPWNYTNTTANFRLLADRLGSSRIRVMWGPADNLNCGEADVATAGFINVKPHLHCLHLKDLHVKDGFHRDFEYRPLGEGDVDFLTVLRSLRNHRCDVVLASATHFRPPSDSRVEAMQINYAKLRSLISRAEDGQ